MRIYKVILLVILVAIAASSLTYVISKPIILKNQPTTSPDNIGEGTNTQQENVEELCGSMFYIEPLETVRFVEKMSSLRLLPHKSSKTIREIEPNTLVEVNDLVEVHDERWHNVTVPVYDTPMDIKGWIKETESVAFTEEKEKQVQSDVTIKAGSIVYVNCSFEEIFESGEVIKDELNRVVNGRLLEIKEGLASIRSGGGFTFWTDENNIQYPKADGVDN